jgi:dienelactone hydrolase
MKLLRILAYIIFFAGFVSSVCFGSSTDKVAGDEPHVAAISGPDYRRPGRVIYGTEEGKLTSSTGCEIVYTYLRPLNYSGDVLIVLGHGFMRSKKRMMDLAQHLASWGLAVANVEFCNSKLWAGNHALNGSDMVAVARKLNVGRGLYTGFSAGGLAALTAAGKDEKAIAVFGLDMVDHKGLGQKTAPELALPFYGLAAAPSMCNADRNGLNCYQKADDAKVIEVDDATHCHFEFPFDSKCTIACGKGEKRFRREEIQQTILGLTTAFFLWQSGIDPRGETWWLDDAENFKNLMKAGYIRILKPQHK